MKDVKTKFDEYVSFGTTPYDEDPGAANGDGLIDIPTVTLDGDYTFADLAAIKKELFRRIKESM